MYSDEAVVCIGILGAVSNLCLVYFFFDSGILFSLFLDFFVGSFEFGLILIELIYLFLDSLFILGCGRLVHLLVNLRNSLFQLFYILYVFFFTICQFRLSLIKCCVSCDDLSTLVFKLFVLFFNLFLIFFGLLEICLFHCFELSI